MMNCYSCNVELSESNSSVEHIINNSIGGRITSKNLLCKPCNEKYGATIDREMDGQLGVFTHHLGIGLQRKKENIKLALKASDGTIKYVGANLVPHDRLSYKLPSGKVVVLQESGKRMRDLIKQKMVELSKKYRVDFVPYTELPNKQERLKIQNSLSDENHDIAFGGDEYFRSIVKMTLNFYLYRGYDPAFCKEVIAMVKGEKGPKLAFYYSPKTIQDPVHDLGDKEVSHIIHIRGDVKNRLLFAYIELFNMQKIIVKYHMDYNGPEINDTYAYELIERREIKKKVSIRLTKPHFEFLHLVEAESVRERQLQYDRLERIIDGMQIPSFLERGNSMQ